MTTTKPFQLGSISTGMLKTEDLIVAFAIELMKYDPTSSDLGEALAFIDGGIVDEAPDGTLESLQNGLNDACPPFVYFGAHPGDGADFGFWPDYDALAERCNWKPGYQYVDSEWVLAEEQLTVRFSDGNVTVMDIDCNILWSTV